MAEVNWQDFWTSYRRKEVATRDDLFFEVGKTINRQRMSSTAFARSIASITQQLGLTTNDRLLELCCGNGLLTSELAAHVKEIQAVDFAEPLVEHAREFSRAPNVTYVCRDAVMHLQELAASRAFVPTKALLGDALAYFEPAQLREILRQMILLTDARLLFLATGIPSDERKWNFYNTPERVRRYEENQRQPATTNDGIGRWWKEEELTALGRELGLATTITPQDPAVSDFRIDALFEMKGPD